jgi:hypothetical protein
MHRLALGVGLCASLTLPAAAQDWRVFSGGAVSQTQFGSQDRRFGLLVGVERSRYEKRLSIGKTPVQEALEGYLLFSHGGGFSNVPRDSTGAVGALYSLRLSTLASRPYGVGLQLGWGLQLANKPTFDLDIRANSTPTAGVRVWIEDFSFTLRLMHISNAGTVMPNRGQNQWQFLLGYQF